MKNNINIIIIRFFYSIVAIALLFTTQQAIAQTRRDSLQRSHNESVNIYGTFKPKIEQTYKINLKPQMFTPHIIKSTFDIEPSPSKLLTQIQLRPIKPVALRVGRYTRGFENFTKIGFGSRISPYVEFFHSTGKRNSNRLNLHIYHFSTFKNINDYFPSPFTATKVEMGFEKYFRYHTLTVNANYGLNTNRYYGVKKSDFPGISFDENNNNLKQAYNMAGFAVQLKSQYKNNDKLTHSLKLSSYYFFDRFGSSELNGNINLNVHKAFSVTEVLDYQRLGLEGDMSYYQNSDSTNNSTNELYFRAMPYFSGKYGIFTFKAGLDFVVLSADSTKFHFYPYLHVNINAIPRLLSLFAGFDGGLKKNTYAKLATENPFLSSRPGKFLWENDKFNFFAGLKGNMSGRFGYHFRYDLSNFDDMAFFGYPLIVDRKTPVKPWIKNEFSFHYANGSSNRFSLGLNYHEGEAFKVWLTGYYLSFQLDNDALPYYQPQLSLEFGANILINNKIRPEITLYYVGQRDATRRTPYGFFIADYKLDAYFDLNFSLNYQITNNLSVFLNITNILNKNYYLFNDYPVEGIQVLAGISYRF